MPHPQGQLLSGPVTNGSPAAKFGTHVDFLGTGGYRALATLAVRDAIPVKNAVEFDGMGSGMRRHLMLVGVQETNTIYVLSVTGYDNLDPADQLAALSDNSNWVSLTEFLAIPPSGVSQAYVDAAYALLQEQITFLQNQADGQDQRLSQAEGFISDLYTKQITDFISQLGVLNIVTDERTFTTDLNAPAGPTLVSSNTLRDPYFQLPFNTNPGPTTPSWTNDRGWTMTNGKAVASNAGYLYQDIIIASPGVYYAKITIDSITSGSLQFLIANTFYDIPPVVGDYMLPVTVTGTGNVRFHIFGQNTFSGVLSYCDYLFEKTGLYFGGDKIDGLQLSGTNLIGTKKNANSNVALDLAPLLAGPDIYNVPTAVRNYAVTGSYNTSNELDMSSIPSGSVSGMRFSYQTYLYEYMPGDAGYLTWIRFRK